jgi:hypothetical protein
MVKIQIIMDEDKILREKKYNLSDLLYSLDRFMVDGLKFVKGDKGFYLGTEAQSDYANCGVAMSRLGREDWFLGNVKTWLFYINDDHGGPDDFIVEDMKEFCLDKYGVAV